MSETIAHHLAVDRFLAVSESATISGCDVWSADATLEATVSKWRFRARGAHAIRSDYAKWFSELARSSGSPRLVTDEGEVVEYMFIWPDEGVPHAAHHAHNLAIRNGLIVADTVLCGGTCSAARRAEMEVANV
jgi:hypothetical protein